MLPYRPERLVPLSRVVRYVVLASACLLNATCYPCHEELMCRTFDVDAWCLESGACDSPATRSCGPGVYCAPLYFGVSAQPQTMTVPVAAFADLRRDLDIVEIFPFGIVPVDVLMDGQAVTCVERGSVLRCDAPPIFSELQLVVAATGYGFSVDIEFTESTCTQQTRVCPS